MTIEIVDKATVKVELTAKEVDARHLAFEKMDSNDAATRRFLMDVLEQVEMETDWDLKGNGLSVEAYQSDEGEIVLYLSCRQRISQSTSKRTPKKNTVSVRSNESGVPHIFSFPTLEALCKACLRLQNQFSHLPLESKLFRAQKKYQLIIWFYRQPEKQLFQILQEYGKLCGRGDIAIAWLEEHGKELISQRAVLEMAKLG